MGASPQPRAGSCPAERYDRSRGRLRPPPQVRDGAAECQAETRQGHTIQVDQQSVSMQRRGGGESDDGAMRLGIDGGVGDGLDD
jgi:hypothetical protein